MKTYDAALAILAPFLPEWTESTIRGFKEEALHNVKLAPEKAKAPTPYGYSFNPGRYVLVHTKNPGHYDRKAAREACLAGKVSADFVTAEGDARAYVKQSTEIFATRLAEKVAICFGPGTEVTLVGHLRFHGAIEGYIDASDGTNKVQFDASSKTNYRYGHESANGNMTQYQQYPFRVNVAEIKGEKRTGLSAEEVGHLITGVDPRMTAHKEKLDRKNAKAERAAKIEKLGKMKDGYNDQASSLGAIITYGDNLEYVGRLNAGVDAIAAKRGIDRCTSKKEALTKAREILAQIKALKAEGKPAAETPAEPVAPKPTAKEAKAARLSEREKQLKRMGYLELAAILRAIANGTSHFSAEELEKRKQDLIAKHGLQNVLGSGEAEQLADKFK